MLEQKKINRSQIFRLIYERRCCKRQDIADELLLSLPTVNQNLKELMEEGLVTASGEFSSTGGRKPQVIMPVRDSKLTIALNIRKTYVRVVLVDLFGDVVKSEREELDFSDTGEYSEKLGVIADTFIAKQKVPKERILGVGITIPGIFDRESEKILIAPTLGIRNYDIKKLTRHIKYPAIVVNDARASAFTYIRRNDSLKYGVYLLVDRGVGGCIINDGKLTRGVNNRAGEIGHMTLIPGGRRCACGKSGCLESYISTARITEEYGAQMDAFFGAESRWTPQFEEYMEMLALGISNLYTIFDCPVIIGGGVAVYLEFHLDTLYDKMKEISPLLLDGVDIRIDDNTRKESLTGAALMLIEDFIKSV